MEQEYAMKKVFGILAIAVFIYGYLNRDTNLGVGIIMFFAFSFWAIVFIRAANNRRYWDDY
ncbi:hypothetical protein EGK75_02015 [Neisseria weixii]|uniref:Uncharacterized protein n=2 Tax=Neisseria weixii TaxID=1853276 RepID=A0A3N4N1R7_9NEIS|nr:hypothetical protein CGZ65_03390 [Neisseria weixii]RPD90184.1 hypothetical protein EGK74_02505 [Neisseria weixii]RPD90244.1 hypothetical protein EGK75_02015 [Neisseria weixii]